MNYCIRCITPDTRPNIRLDREGVCNACRTHESRAKIDWCRREQEFRDVAKHARQRSTGYDCIIPVSGGKDSTWQVLTCLEYGLKPLCVTWRTPGRTELGERNLRNLVSLGVDHIDYSIDPQVERRFMVKALERCGSTAIPMHLALFAIPLRLAERFAIPLVVWGENSAFEYGAAEEAHTGFRLDEDWLRVYGVSQGTTARDWIDADLSERDLTPYFGPQPGALAGKRIMAVFLGYYFAWDPAMTRAAALAHGFTPRAQGPATGYYDYADIDDAFISLHHYLKWPKFGFTRLFDNLSLEIRHGRLTRAQAVQLVAGTGEQTPIADIAAFCKFAGIPIQRFWNAVERFRNTAIWHKKKDGIWWLPDFLIPDWPWSGPHAI
ncbi:MAG: N-acetyl sugar amidotransferase [Desulfobacteraceae bacterium]|nr:MAG: N-acetyl sugar amidotransferase [Desulfobacteraceae bacterium]